jgi:hypothetical protein
VLCLVVFIVAYVLEEDGKTGIEKKAMPTSCNASMGVVLFRLS